MLRMGHRGTTRSAVENTPAAFRKAMDSGADGVELDIRMTKDGILVVSHDPKVDHMTNGRGYIRDMNFNELRRLKIRGSEECIATSQEAFDAMIEKGMPKAVQVDLKVSGAGPQLLEQIYSRGMQDIVIISSFHKSLLREIRELDSGIKTGLIKILPANGPIEYLAPETDDNSIKRKIAEKAYRAYLYVMLIANRITGSAHSDLISDAKEVNADYAMFYWRAATSRFVKRAHRNDLEVMAGIVNSEKGIRRLERIGVDAITTDLSELLRKPQPK